LYIGICRIKINQSIPAARNKFELMTSEKNRFLGFFYVYKLGPLRHLGLSYWPARLHRLTESIPGLFKRLQIRAPVFRSGVFVFSFSLPPHKFGGLCFLTATPPSPMSLLHRPERRHGSTRAPGYAFLT
jgi:hypothetical protein